MRSIDFHKATTVIITVIILLAICTSGSGCASSEKVPADALLIEGSGVEDPAFFTLDELKAMEDGLVEANYISVNSYGTKAYSHHKGIWIGYILNEKVVLKDNASQVTFIAVDDYKVDYSLKEVMREDYIDEQKPETKYKMILAWEENGRQLDPQIGPPLQLVVGQRQAGDVNKPYWVRYVKTIRID